MVVVISGTNGIVAPGLTSEDSTGTTTLTTQTLVLGGTTVTATGAELNFVDGVTSNLQTQLDAKGTVSSLSDLSITADATELNTLDGITASTAELNTLTGITATAAELNYNDITALGTVEASKVVTADANGDVTFPDGEKIVLGTGGDLEIYHDGSHTYIKEAGDATGSLRIRGENLVLENNSGSDYLNAVTNAQVELFYNGFKKIETTSVGADVTGEFIATSYNETYSALTAAATVDVDCETGNFFSLTTDQNTTFTFSNPPASGTGYGFILEITQGGAYTLTFPASVDWAGGAAPDAPGSGEKAIYVFITRDGGTTWYGFQGGTAFA